MNELRLVEYFWTFQGEGANWGRRAFFVRVPFCNLACSWCDTEFNKYIKVEVDTFLNAALSEPSRLAVITGGEPTMNKQTPQIIQILKAHGFEIAMESNGCFTVPNGVDFLTVSPKRDADYEINPDAMMKADEFKFIVDDDFDFSVLDPITSLKTLARKTLSPEFGNLQSNVDKIETFITENPQWRMSLQTHKFIGRR